MKHFLQASLCAAALLAAPSAFAASMGSGAQGAVVRRHRDGRLLQPERRTKLGAHGRGPAGEKMLSSEVGPRVRIRLPPAASLSQR
jgi:hypothetical protein